MITHLTRAMHQIKKEILSLGAMVEDRFKKAIYAIQTEDLAHVQRNHTDR